ncbi:MAG: histidine kinase [Desulfobulbaceae bacterium]|nr:MAG: histidine kinase [Desulfobulbaceae bacterium]
MSEPVTILCVDDEANVLKALQRLFMDEEYELLTAETGEQGLALLDQEPATQIVISDYRMPGMNGVDFLKEVCARRPDTVRIVLSGYADTAAIVSAINEGQIYKFIPKPWNDDELRVTIAKAIELYFLQQENSTLSRELQDTNEELKVINDNLEKMVEERTQEILFQNKVLANAHFILNSLPVGVLGVDLDGCVVQCNRKCRELIGNPSLEVGADSDDVLPPSILEILGGIGPEKTELHSRLTLEESTLRGTAVYMDSDQGQKGKILVVEAEHT